jgi:hypothetical protein
MVVLRHRGRTVFSVKSARKRVTPQMNVGGVMVMIMMMMTHRRTPKVHME